MNVQVPEPTRYETTWSVTCVFLASVGAWTRWSSSVRGTRITARLLAGMVTVSRKVPRVFFQLLATRPRTVS